MDALCFDNMPDMRHPYLLLTYEGWSNAAGVATAAGQFLIEHLGGERFASMIRRSSTALPSSVLKPATTIPEKQIIWPENDFYFCPQPQLEHDIIIATGVEPHLKWRTFTNLMIEFIKKCNVYQTITLGALWADVLYSAPVPFSGSATDPELAERFGLGSGSRYEGPTGMVGVLHDTLRRNDLASASIWANMPYYVSVTPNPKGILALSQRGMEIVGLPTDFPELEEEAGDFDSRVAEAIAKDPKVQAHVRDLERRAAREQRSRPSPSLEQETPDGSLAAVERFCGNSA